MTFAAHGALGSGLAGIGMHLAGGDPGMVALAHAYGFITGSLPDALDWVLANLDFILRWKLYVWFHHRMPAWLKVLLLFTWLHVESDKIIHKHPGYNWWPKYWYLEVGMWVSAFVLHWFTWGG